MDFGLFDSIERPTMALLAGSALLAGGASVLLGAILYWIRSRRRRLAVSLVTESVGTQIDLTDAPVEEAPATIPVRPAVDLREIDLRLEDVERQLERLVARIDAVARQRETRNVTRPVVSDAKRADQGTGSDEERALREMVAASARSIS